APQEVRDTMIKIVEGVATNGVNAEEVTRAKRKLLAEWQRLMTKSQEIAIGLSEWAAAGDWRLMFIYRDRIAKVTPKDIVRVAAEYLKQNNRTVGMYLPTTQVARAVIPKTPSVQDLVKDYKGGKALAQGEAFDPTPANLEKRTKRVVLAGGVKAALLPKKTRGEAVLASLTLRFGNEKSLGGQTSATQFLGSLMMRGTRKLTRQQIEDEQDKLEAQLTASSGVDTLSFAIEAKRATLPGVLALLGQVLREPIFPEEEFGILKRASRQTLEKQMVEPGPLAATELARRLNPYPKDDIRYVPTPQEALARLDAVTRDQMGKLYTEQVGATVGELAIVGDFDPEATVKQVEGILKDWKAAVPYQRISQTANLKVPGSRAVIETPDKENATYLAAELLQLTDTSPDYPALT